MPPVATTPIKIVGASIARPLYNIINIIPLAFGSRGLFATKNTREKFSGKKWKFYIDIDLDL